MPWYDAGLDDQLNGAAPSTRIAFFTADPGPSGANEIAGTGRPATTWGAAEASTTPVGRRRVGSQVGAPIPASTTVAWWGISSAATGGTLKGAWPLATPEAFGSAGTINLTPTLLQTN